jgi:hypothetical protein
MRWRPRRHQRLWAERRGIVLDEQGYTLSLNDNLLQPLNDGTRAEFEAGDGSELGAKGARGKMQALHSSSALACNIFDYWRNRDSRVLVRALDLSSSITKIQFEQKFPTGIGPRSPNLDVVLSLADGSLVAVESKFCEPYSRKVPSLSLKYLPEAKRLWADGGFSECQSLVRAVCNGELSLSRLDTAQLLKHVLGLSRAARRWELLYLWYDDGSDAATEHRTELAAFEQTMRADRVAFRWLTYQQVMDGLTAACGAEHGKYIAYVRDRYFAPTDPVHLSST